MVVVTLFLYLFQIWWSGRQLCEIQSLTGQPCVYPVLLTFRFGSSINRILNALVIKRMYYLNISKYSLLKIPFGSPGSQACPSVGVYVNGVETCFSYNCFSAGIRLYDFILILVFDTSSAINCL